MKPYQQIKSQLLKDKQIHRAYKALEPEFALVQMIIERRIKKGLTQAALARKIGTKQSAIARLESGNSNPTVKFLEKVASALGTKLIVAVS